MWTILLAPLQPAAGWDRGSETGARHASHEASGASSASGCNMRERRRRRFLGARRTRRGAKGQREWRQLGKREKDDCLLHDAAAVRYRLHASPNLYVRARAPFVCLSPCFRHQNFRARGSETTRASKHGDAEIVRRKTDIYRFAKSRSAHLNCPGGNV